jgi:hypothetical protein
MSLKDTYGNPLLPGEGPLFGDRNLWLKPPKGHFSGDITRIYGDGSSTDTDDGKGKGKGGSRRRRVRPSRKYKKSAKRVFRKKSRSTRRR